MANRSVIITGAAHGIGAACARRFAAEGDRLVLVDTDEEAGSKIAEDLQNDTNPVSFVQADTMSRLHVHNVIAEVLESYEKVDILVNAAVMHFSSPFLETSEEEFNNVLQHNLTGPFLMCQAVAKQMIRQQQDSDQNISSSPDMAIVNIGSVEGVTTQADHVAFATSQGGLHQMTKGIALSLSDYGIRVNAIGAGLVRGEGDATSSTDKATPLNRLGEPDDVANVAWFLTSPQAAFMTGQMIYVDGGQIICNPTQTDHKKTTNS